MKAYMNKFKAPGIHKIPVVNKPNQTKKEDQKPIKSQSTLSSPQSSKPIQVVVQDNQSLSVIYSYSYAQKKPEKNQKEQTNKPNEGKVEKYIPPQAKEFKEESYRKTNKESDEKVSSQSQSESDESQQEQDLTQEKVRLLQKQAYSTQNKPTINQSQTQKQSQQIYPTQSLVGCSNNQQKKEQNLSEQKPTLSPKDQSLFSSFSKIKQTTGPLPPGHSLFGHYTQKHLKKDSSQLTSQSLKNAKAQTINESNKLQQNAIMKQSLFGQCLLDYSSLSKNLFGDCSSQVKSSPLKKQKTKKQTKAQTNVQKWTPTKQQTSKAITELMSSFYQDVKSQTMKQIINKKILEAFEQQQKRSAQKQKDKQALLSEIESLRAKNPKPDHSLYSVSGFNVTQTIYEELPVETHLASLKRHLNTDIKRGLVKALVDPVKVTIEHQIDQGLSKTAQKVENLVKITHNYLKKHGELPKIEHVNLEPIKVKFQVEIPYQMKFVVGDFGELVSQQTVKFQNFQ